MSNRQLYLGEWEEVEFGHGCIVLTPNENAAATLGAPPLSLETLAQQVLGEEQVAHPVMVQRLLRESANEVLGSADPDGVARTLHPIRRGQRRSGQ